MQPTHTATPAASAAPAKGDAAVTASGAGKSVLICGASFAGLASAYWMRRLGYAVTVVELAQSVKKGGTPVDIKERTVDVVKRMGLYEQVVAHKLSKNSTAFIGSGGETLMIKMEEAVGEGDDEEHYEIERDTLLDLLQAKLGSGVHWMFGDSVASLADGRDSVEVGFRSGQRRSFDLVLGCDGQHSVVRRLTFGDEAQYSHFLRAYFSITIVDQLLIERDTCQLYNEPSRMLMLNAYKGKTDICFIFGADSELSYDYHDEAQQRRLVEERFKSVGWRGPELLAEVQRAKGFYFDKLSQIHMPAWSKGRVALVGDAGYCPSPAAGRGGSVALDGAAALGEAFEKCGGDYRAAFEEYDRSFRPFIEQLQAQVVEFSMDMLLPRTEEALARRNAGPPRGEDADEAPRVGA